MVTPKIKLLKFWKMCLHLEDAYIRLAGYYERFLSRGFYGRLVVCACFSEEGGHLLPESASKISLLCNILCFLKRKRKLVE